MTSDHAIEMFVGGLVLDPNTQAPVVVLKDETGRISLPIWIGVPEATAIAGAVKQLTVARPLTHDLLYDMVTELGAKVQQIVVTDLKDSTYIAEMVCTSGEKTFVFDCRPSDAINIALRASAPIFVSEVVLEKAKVISPEGAEPGDDDEDVVQKDFTTVDKDKWEEILHDLDPDDFKYKA